MHLRFCLFTLEWKGAAFKYVSINGMLHVVMLSVIDYINVAIQASKLQKVSHPNYTTSAEVPW